jgi:hypothetical protein
MEGNNDGKWQYDREQYDGSLRDFPVANPFPKKTTY